MAGTVTSNLISFTNADSATGWTTTGTAPNPGLALDNDVFIQGTGAISWGLKSATTYTIWAPTANINLRDKHLYMWLRCDAIARCVDQSAGGVQIVIGGSTTQFGQWYVAGQDTYDGSWKCFVLDCNSPSDAQTGGWADFLISNINYIGWRFVLDAATSKGVPNAWADAIYYGDSINVYGGTPASPATFEDMYSASNAVGNKWGIFDKNQGVYIPRGRIVIGSGSSNTYFEDSAQILTFASDWVSQSLYSINITGSNTTCSLGTGIGEGNSVLGVDPVIIRGAADFFRPFAGGLGNVTRSLKPPLNIDSNIHKLSLYGSVFDSMGRINFGTEQTPMAGNKLVLVDNSFSLTNAVYKNLIGDFSQSLRNKFISTSGSSAGSVADYIDGYPFALKLVDTGSIDGDKISILNTYGFTSTGSSAAETYQISNHDFSSNIRYLTVYGNKTWDIVNPIWNTPITTGSIKFTVSQSNYVNEKYSYNSTVTTTDGTPISGSKVYIYEGSLTDTVQYTLLSSTNGLASTNIIKTIYTPTGSITSPSSSIKSSSYATFANKVYQYGYSPYIAGITVTSPIVQTIALVEDANINEGNQLTAISNGANVSIKYYTGSFNPAKVINYKSGSATLTSGSSVTGSASGATGKVLEYIGDSELGTVVLVEGNSTLFSHNEVLQVSSIPYATSSVLESDGGFSGSYTWVVDCGSEGLSVVYDALAAHMAEYPISSSYNNVLIWGQSNQSQLLYVGASGYFTNRSRNQGVWVAKKGTGTISFLTSNEGYLYVPPAQYTLTLTGLIAGSEVRIYLTGSTSDSIMGDELTGIESSGTTFGYTYTYKNDQYVDVVVHNTNYEYLRVQNVLLTNANSSIPIQQRIDRNYANP